MQESYKTKEADFKAGFTFPSKVCVSLTKEHKNHDTNDALSRTLLNGPALVIVNLRITFLIIEKQSPNQEPRVTACVTRASSFHGADYISY